MTFSGPIARVNPAASNRDQVVELNVQNLAGEEQLSLRAPGAILLISCYELGHQPIGLAQPLGFLEHAGYAPAAMDIAVEDIDPAHVTAASFVGISVPMHTALRLGVRVAGMVRHINPTAHICFYGLYASINAEYLLQKASLADTVIGGEYEAPLMHLIAALDRGEPDVSDLAGVSCLAKPDGGARMAAPYLERAPRLFPPASRSQLPSLDKYAKLEQDGKRHLAGYVEASRGCLHRCLHCPIVPVYQGRFFLVPEDAVLEDIRRQVAAGAKHMTFGDPDFLNGPGHSLKIVRAMHAEFPAITFDCTAKIDDPGRRRRRRGLPAFVREPSYDGPTTGRARGGRPTRGQGAFRFHWMLGLSPNG